MCRTTVPCLDSDRDRQDGVDADERGCAVVAAQGAADRECVVADAVEAEVDRGTGTVGRIWQNLALQDTGRARFNSIILLPKNGLNKRARAL